MTIKLNEQENKILRVLVSEYDNSSWGETGFFGFKLLAARAELPLEVVRRPVRSLARKGLAIYKNGLTTEDGQMAGAGYAATKDGALFINPCVDCKVAVADMNDGRCSECWENRKCVKCGKAYRNHELKNGYMVEFEFNREI